MNHLLLTRTAADSCVDEFAAIAAHTATIIRPIYFPETGELNLNRDEEREINAAYISPDLVMEGGSVRRFFNYLELLPNLKWVHSGFAGIDHPVFGKLLKRGVKLSNSPGAASEPIAHSAMAGLLSLARRLPYFANQQHKQTWQRLPPDLIAEDLSSQTLVVYGLGAIGTELARLASAFGLYTIGVRRHPRRTDDAVDELVHPDDLNVILPRADWLAVTANLTKDTRGAIGEDQLGRLPSGAHVLNVARGAIIDEPALIASLQSGHLGGAYLDVFAVEPLPMESPLWKLPNVIVSPHNSWAAKGNTERARLIFLTNLEAWLGDEPLPHHVSER